MCCNVRGERRVRTEIIDFENQHYYETYYGDILWIDVENIKFYDNKGDYYNEIKVDENCVNEIMRIANDITK